MASIDDPTSWHLFANLDHEFLQQINSEEISIPLRDGSSSRALVYRRKCDAVETRPLLALVHGGGFRVGNAELESSACIGATRELGCISVSLEHRLVPEFKFPVAYEDIWDALLWEAHSGAHIANPLVHRARDQKLHPPITGVYLNTPPTLAPQALTDTYRDIYKSRDALKDGFTLTGKSIEMYDQELQPDFASPLWSPLLWPTGHASIPPTFFQICGADLLRDDALIYERELRLKYGVKTRAIVYQGLPHVFWYTHPSLTASKRFTVDTVSGVAWLLGMDMFEV
ncbi:alpha/beta-hydrolase [Aspergillus similis]